MKICIACGMPMNKPEDFGQADENCQTCVYCTNEDGSVKSCAEIFEGGVQFFMANVSSDRALAERLTRKNMKKLPYWQGKTGECLDGEEASDAEFEAMLEQL